MPATLNWTLGLPNFSPIWKGCCSENIPPIPPWEGGIFFEKNDQLFFTKLYPHTPLSSILLTSYTSRIPTHHPSYLNNFFTINYLIKSCSGTSLSLPGDPRMISGFSSINYPIPSQSPRNTPLIWIRNWLFLFHFFSSYY